MCVSAWPAVFSRTIVGTWEVLVEERLNHVMWYQNRVGKDVPDSTESVFHMILLAAMYGAPWRELYKSLMTENNIPDSMVESEGRSRKSGKKPREYHQILEANGQDQGNCLIIPVLGSWSSIRLLNTAAVPNLLKDIAESLRLPVELDSWAPEKIFVAGAGGIAFLQFDIYDIVLAERASAIPPLLSQIRKEKRPAVNEAVFDAFENWYGCPVAVCCFRESERGEGKPLAFAFEPLYPEQIVVYTLDGHDGNAPSPSALVEMDHTVFVGSYLNNSGGPSATIHYSEQIPADLEPYLLNSVMGTQIRQPLENGDIVFSTHDVRTGIFNGLRTLPPRAPADLPRLGHRVTREQRYDRLNSVRGWGQWTAPDSVRPSAWGQWTALDPIHKLFSKLRSSHEDH